jgi:hypothetical protein
MAYYICNYYSGTRLEALKVLRNIEGDPQPVPRLHPGTERVQSVDVASLHKLKRLFCC